jgi:hypothetical protein
MSEGNSILGMRSAGLRPWSPPTISAGASRINKRKFTTQNGGFSRYSQIAVKSYTTCLVAEGEASTAL